MPSGKPVVLGGTASWAMLCVALTITTDAAQRPTTAATKSPATARLAPVRAHAAAPLSHDGQNALIRRHCVTCHNDKAKTGGLSLASYDAARAADAADVTERMIRKLQAGMMPPPGAPRPDAASAAALVSALETSIDTAAAAKPNPGRRTFQRLNRAEYRRAIRNLLALDVDAGDWLPLDRMSANFDNIADEQALSPTLLESYLNAAGAISRLAIGDRNAAPIDETYTNPGYVSQHPWDHVPGAPYGTRGGMVVDHVFPADAEYVFEVMLVSGDNARYEDLDLSIDGERVALLQYEQGPAAAADGRGGTSIRTEPIVVRAGQHRVAAAFVRRIDGPYEDLMRPHEWSFAGGGSGGSGITTLPHLRDLIVSGPFRATGISETTARQKIFSCRPTAASEERACAREIVTRLAGEAYRRPAAAAEIDRLMPLYEASAAKAGFESGVRAALEAILASPHFIFRLEREPRLRPERFGEPAQATGPVRIADLDLASRLSFFLWATPPDHELLAVAARGELSKPQVLEQQARRMLAHPRAESLGTRFAYQWLRLQDVDKVRPDPNFYPNFDENLAAAMRRETELFFYGLVRDDRSVLDLLNADYTYVNDRLARHYGFAGISGSEFRRLTYPDDTRRGLLGHGSVLVQTSMANRTSPVLRGKWVMEVLLGSPPPPPPPDVPDLEATAEAKAGRLLTTRERLEMHRANPTCNACHRFMDPIGLALDNFDVTAKWRLRENGSPVDTKGDFYDGTPVSTPAQLTAALMKRPAPLVRTFTENLMAYALGRRVEFYDQPAVRAIARQAEANDYRMSSFILGIVKSDAFRMKQAAAPETEETTGRQ
jgi:hypothetical protein